MPRGHATPSSGDLTLLPGQRLSQQTPPNEPPLSPTPRVTSACRDNTALCQEPHRCRVTDGASSGWRAAAARYHRLTQVKQTRDRHDSVPEQTKALEETLAR